MQKLPFGTFFGTGISYFGQLSPFFNLTFEQRQRQVKMTPSLLKRHVKLTPSRLKRQASLTTLIKQSALERQKG